MTVVGYNCSFPLARDVEENCSMAEQRFTSSLNMLVGVYF